MTVEKMLWLAVLDQALNDWIGAGCFARAEGPHVHQSARAWFFSNGLGLGSFLYVCDVLDLDPAWFRKQLLEAPPLELKHRLDQHHRWQGRPATPILRERLNRRMLDRVENVTS